MVIRMLGKAIGTITAEYSVALFCCCCLKKERLFLFVKDDLTAYEEQFILSIRDNLNSQ